MSLEQIKTDITSYRDKVVAYLDTHAAVFTPVIEALERFEPRITCDSNSLDIALTGDKHVLEAVWGILRRNGYNILVETDRPKPNSPTYSQFFYREGEGHDHSLDRARIWLTYTSTVCRRVKVGTKMVEQDVYETVCGEQEIAQQEVAS